MIESINHRNEICEEIVAAQLHKKHGIKVTVNSGKKVGLFCDDEETIHKCSKFLKVNKLHINQFPFSNNKIKSYQHVM